MYRWWSELAAEVEEEVEEEEEEEGGKGLFRRWAPLLLSWYRWELLLLLLLLLLLFWRGLFVALLCLWEEDWSEDCFFLNASQLEEEEGLGLEEEEVLDFFFDFFFFSLLCFRSPLLLMVHTLDVPVLPIVGCT